MTNQMKMILKTSLMASFVTSLLSLTALFVNGIGFLYKISYFVLGLSLLLTIILFILYLNMKSDERAFKRQIAYYKLLKELRNKAILEFYARFGLKPQYDKNGNLLTPDEFLGIITKLNSEGKLEPSIYEQLGILPVFDKDGKEVPVILVLKHLIKKIKTEGLKDIQKLKGLYAKGTKKEKKPETKKVVKKVASKESGAGKKGKKSEKELPGAEYEEKKVFPEFKDSNKGKKSEKKEPPKQEKAKEPLKKPQKTSPDQKTSVPTVEPVNLGEDYLARIYKNQEPQKNVRPNKTKKTVQEQRPESEYGECTPE